MCRTIRAESPDTTPGAPNAPDPASIGIAMPSSMSSPRVQRGFSMLEMSVVLVVIGLILSAVSIGRNVYQAAQMQRVASDFVQGWALAYDAYLSGSGHVPGDQPASPSGRVNNGGVALCGQALRDAMQAAGVDLPAGRAEGLEDLYVYQDGNGNPQQLAVCFQSVAWAEPGATSGSYQLRNRNVMTLNGLTPAMASTLDQYFDGHIDASFGRLRETLQASQAAPRSSLWSADERDGMTGLGRSFDEDQIVVLNGLLLMVR
jgi:prepilin-type N-terminal cleavage/methylation domain-containing protein